MLPVRNFYVMFRCESYTGGEAIAEMLLQNSELRDLNVSWNSIRGDSALTLGQSIAYNNGLQVRYAIAYITQHACMLSNLFVYAVFRVVTLS